MTIGNTLIRTPTQASDVYGLNGRTIPRNKGLFYVIFNQNTTSASTSTGWQNNMGFVVKQVDRPSVQPLVEELNQYNKKRQVTVGYKMQPLKMVLYDTADSMVMQMWNDYTQWYFGDFSQNSTSWAYDVTTMNFTDNGAGFGYQPQTNNNDART